MNYTAFSHSMKITSGAVVAFEARALGPSDQELVFKVGDAIAFRLALGPAGSGTVVSIDQADCDFAFDGDTWRMSPKREGDAGGDSEAGIEFREWIVRERVGE